MAALDNTPVGDPIDDRIATLGRVLFHDRRLSVSDAVACASCHRQATGFDDPARFSVGFSGTSFTTAHAMRLANLRYWAPGSMFWDRRVAFAALQASQPIQHPVEMGFDASNGGIAALLSNMAGIVYAPELFQFAFGDAAITEARIQRALAHFERAIVSSDSRWDRGYAALATPQAPNPPLGSTVPGLSASENAGLLLFIRGPQAGGLGCASCHVPPSFALAANSRSNGLDAGESRVFKSPSLKNVGTSTAFMHDGRFSTLAQVVDHYDAGIQNGPALDNRLRPGGTPLRLGLTPTQKQDLVAFLSTLADPTLAADPRFGSPFKP